MIESMVLAVLIGVLVVLAVLTSAAALRGE